MRYLSIPLLLGLLVLAGCQGNRSLPNEQNPFYQQGLSLRSEGKMEDAVRAFQACLRYSPTSDQAHLQLAMLYEDHLIDLPRAIVHYHAFLELSKNEDLNEQARSWMTRTEKKYYEELTTVYGDPVARVAAPTIVATPPQHLQAHPEPPPAPETKPDVPAQITASDSHLAEVMPKPQPPAPQPPAAVPEPPPEKPPEELRYHTVKRGETLSAISKQYYNTPNLWRLIYDANRDTLASPERLNVDQKLKVPEKPR